MQYALMHKWLEHLTHTNIHISPEEEIPQGWDRAICVWKTEHSIQRKTDHRTKIYLNDSREDFKRTTRMTTFRQIITWFKWDVKYWKLSYSLLMWKLSDTRWYFFHRYKLVKCHVHTRVCEMCRWVGLGNYTTLRSVMEKKKLKLPSVATYYSQ